MGTTAIVEDVQTIIHVVNLDNIQEIVTKIEDDLKPDGLTTWLKNKIRSINQKMRILGSRRQKRGLINPVGTVGKWLFGSMDNEDREEINRHIQNIEQGMQDTIQTVNQQIHINDYFNRTLHLLATKENDIIKNRNDVTNSLKDIFKEQKKLEALLKLQILEDKIDNLLDNIASIKNGILHPGILLAEEIDNYNITIEKLENAKTGIIATQNNRLFLAINIPKKYKTVPYQILYPVPDQSYQEIDEIPKSFIKLNGSKFGYIEEKILYERDLKPLKSCIVTNNCNRKFNLNVEIIRINDNVILCKNLNKEKIVNHCDERELVLTGHYVLTIFNCSLEIRNKAYVHISKQYIDNEVFEILPNVNVEIINQTTIEDIQNIKKLYLHKNISIGINITFVVVILAIIMFFVMYRRKKKLPILELKTQYLPKDKFALNDGGVILSVPREREIIQNYAVA